MSYDNPFLRETKDPVEKFIDQLYYHKNIDKRADAARALVNYADDKRVLHALKQSFDRGNVKDTALGAMFDIWSVKKELGWVVNLILNTAVSDVDKWERRNALFYLRHIDDPRVLVALNIAIKDGDSDVRVAAKEVLADVEAKQRAFTAQPTSWQEIWQRFKIYYPKGKMLPADWSSVPPTGQQIFQQWYCTLYKTNICQP